MGRFTSLLATVAAILLPVAVAYVLRPVPGQYNHAIRWVLFVGISLMLSAIISGFAIYAGYGRYRSIPMPRPLHRQLEQGFLILPPLLFIGLVGWRMLSAGT
ncbi:membrane hypothetical protein [Xanthomonas hortorum pv. vitians]|nr:membrane hypothetical protein [Xanthomonas hortorum pv. vitians]